MPDIRRALRAAGAPLRLAAARLRRRPGAWLLVAAGTAVAVALLIVAVGGGAVAGERAAARILASGPPAGRSLRLSWSGGLPAGVDARARRTLATAGGGSVTHALLLQPRAVDRHQIELVGLEPLVRALRLTSGRLPRRCGPVVCEVVQLGGPPVSGRLDGRPSQRVVLRVVGRAAVRSGVPLGFDPARQQPPGQGGGPPAVLAGPAGGVERLPGLSGVYRTHSWTAPLALAGVPTWRLGDVARRISGVRDGIEQASGAFALDAPLTLLDRAEARAHAARRRVALVGGGAAALLLAFVVLAAGALGRSLRDERDRLRRRGGRGWQGAALDLTECGWAVGWGVVAGAAVGLAATAIRASADDVPAGGLLAHRVLAGAAVPLLVAGWIVVTVLLVLAVRAGARGLGRFAWGAAAAAVAALAIALARGGVGAADVGGGGDPLPGLLPLLACLAGGVLVAAVAAPALRLGERAARGGPLSVRLAALGLARSPRAAALAVAFVAVTVGLACFASAYAATLRRGETDAAAFRVPLDATVRPGPTFARPFEVAGPARWRALAGGGTVLPVLRAGGTVPAASGTRPIAVTGLPADGLTRIGGWRGGDTSPGPAALARALAAGAPAGPRGPVVAPGAPLRVRGRASGDAVDVSAHLVSASGEPVEIPLGTAGPRDTLLHGSVPPSPVLGPLRLVSVEAREAAGLLLTEGHAAAEGARNGDVASGRLTLGPLRAGRETITASGWTARGGLTGLRAQADGGATVAYSFDRTGRALLGPPQPTDGHALPAVVDPATAREAGHSRRVLASVEGVRLPLHVAGTAKRLPGVAGSGARFALLDAPTLATALQAASPGATGAPQELWLDLHGAGAEARLRAALRTAPLDRMGATFRADVAAALRGDPLGAELLDVLRVAAVLGLVLAALGLLLVAAAALRDEGDELYDLEAQGLGPAALRTHVRLRVALLGLLGLVAGLVLGVVLVVLVTGAVQVTAGLNSPEPPLVAVLPWGAWAVGAAAFALAAALAVAARTRGAFGGPVPRRSGAGA